MPGLCVNETDWSLFRTHIIVTKTTSKKCVFKCKFDSTILRSTCVRVKVVHGVNGCTLPLLTSEEIVK